MFVRAVWRNGTTAAYRPSYLQIGHSTPHHADSTGFGRPDMRQIASGLFDR